eukprot:m.163197 g.163197  ORF g.163197 m.163197 type:complete len:2596 (-) comp15214_c0_seq1:1529-9316(-)
MAASTETRKDLVVNKLLQKNQINLTTTHGRQNISFRNNALFKSSQTAPTATTQVPQSKQILSTSCVSKLIPQQMKLSHERQDIESHVRQVNKDRHRRTDLTSLSTRSKSDRLKSDHLKSERLNSSNLTLRSTIDTKHSNSNTLLQQFKPSLLSKSLSPRLEASSHVKQTKTTINPRLRSTLNTSSILSTLSKKYALAIDKVDQNTDSNEEDEDEVSNAPVKILNTYDFSNPFDKSLDDNADLNMELNAVESSSFDRREPLTDLERKKLRFVNTMACSLVGSSEWFQPSDPTRQRITEHALEILQVDPEFVLKVALYARQELNLRTPSNLLLAFAASQNSSKALLKKYFSATIRLPSDWIEVAELCLTFKSGSDFGTLPTALRKAMVHKFSEFDEYQLAKYNRKGKPRAKHDVREGNTRADSADTEGGEELELKSFTLKQLIRRLHIADPAQFVMAIVGKKYPDDPASFAKSRLPGVFNRDLAGKRMKLKVPITWETQVSSLGNVASTWEMLIDNRKLPFMAMLRNLRNLLLANISTEHHDKICRMLTNHHAVVSSRQFPFRFFSAFEVLKQLKSNGTSQPNKRNPRPNSKSKKKKGDSRSNEASPEFIPSNQTISRYMGALDAALRIATRYNVKPIKGHTLILCCIDDCMRIPCSTAKGLGKPREVLEIGILTGLMCKYAAEDCTFVLYSRALDWHAVQLKEGTILHNMESLMEVASKTSTTICNRCGCRETTEWSSMCDCASCVGEGCAFAEVKSDVDNGFPLSRLKTLLLMDQIHVDTFMHLSNSGTDPCGIYDTVRKYRELTDSKLLYVSINLSANVSSIEDTVGDDPRTIRISGYSDAVLRYIADQGEGAAQLAAVDCIDAAFNLESTNIDTGGASIDRMDSKMEEDLSVPITTKWNTARVFISSTFRDMHGERDMITQYVIPELKSRAQRHNVLVEAIDLRWGITAAESQKNQSIALCLDEIHASNFFVGLLGDRYGSENDKYNTPDEPRFEWTKSYPPGRSVTEIEMYYAALNPEAAGRRCYFALRSNNHLNDIPDEYEKDFASSPEAATKLETLKKLVLASGHEVLDQYHATWGGVVNNKPIVRDLEELGHFLVEKLWKGIQEEFHLNGSPVQTDVYDPGTLVALHKSFGIHKRRNTEGRKQLLQKIVLCLQDKIHPIVALVGKRGMGKSVIMSVLCNHLNSIESVGFVAEYYVGSIPDSHQILSLLRTILLQLHQRFRLGDFEFTNDVMEAQQRFSDALIAASRQTVKLIVIAIDGVYDLESTNLQWLPKNLPETVRFIVSASKGPACDSLLRRSDVSEVKLSGLSFVERANIVRSMLVVYGKHLDESPFNNQLKLLTTKREAGSPLYLALACEELRLSGVFENLTEHIKQMSGSIESLFLDIIARLEREISETLIAFAFQLFCCTQYGLREFELKSILRVYSKVDHISPLTLARLWQSLTPFLRVFNSNDGSMVLSSGLLAKVIKNRFLRTEAAVRETHQILALYYISTAHETFDGCFLDKRIFAAPYDVLKKYKWVRCSTHALLVLPYHLQRAHEFGALHTILISLGFIAAKALKGLSSFLPGDYVAYDYVASGTGNRTRLEAQALNKMLQLQDVRDFAHFVTSNVHIFAENPILILQQAMNTSRHSCVSQAVQTLLENPEENKDIFLSSTVPKIAICWQNKPDHQSLLRMTIKGFATDVTCLAISPDGSLMACGSLDGSVALYLRSSGAQLNVLRGHVLSISSIGFVSNDSICTASSDGIVILWNLHTGQIISKVNDHNRKVSSISVDSKGDLLATSSLDCTIRFYKGKTLKSHGYVRGPSSPVNSVAMHPEGTHAAAGYWNASIFVFDVEKLKTVATLKGHKQSVRDLSYSPNARHIVSCSSDGSILMWSTKSYTLVGSFSGHDRPINRLSFPRDGDQFATASDDGTIKMWRGQLGYSIDSWKAPDEVAATCARLSGSKTKIAVGFSSGKALVFSLEGVIISTLEVLQGVAVSSVCWGENDEFLLVGLHDGSLCFFDMQAGTLLETVRKHTQMIRDLTFCGKFDLMVSASADCSIRVWNSDTVESIGLHNHTGEVTAARFLQIPNTHATTILSCSRDCSLIVWRQIGHDWKKWNPVQKLDRCHMDWINGLAVSALADFVLTVGNDCIIKKWKVTADLRLDPNEVDDLKGHESAVTSIDIFDKNKAVSGGADGSVHVWSLLPLAEITSLEKSEMGISSIAALNNGTTIVTCEDGTITSYSVMQGLCKATLTGHGESVCDVGVCSGGKVIVSCGVHDRAIRVWDNPLKTASRQSIHGVTSLDILDNVVVAGYDSGELSIHVLEDEDLKPCCRRRTAHSAAITGTCFITSDTLDVKRVCSVSKDGYIRLWSLHMTNSDEYVLTEESQLKIGTPLTCVTYRREHNTLIAGSWEGAIFLVSNNIRGIELLSKRMPPREDSENVADWVSAISTDPNSACIRIAQQNGYIWEYDMNDQRNNRIIVRDHSFQNDTQQPWVCTMSNNAESALLTGNRGSLFGFSPTGTKLFDIDIHAKNIVAIINTKNDELVTASSDGLVKVWSCIGTEVSPKGMFACESGCTALACSKETYVVGDRLGQIYLLTAVRMRRD